MQRIRDDEPELVSRLMKEVACRSSKKNAAPRRGTASSAGQEKESRLEGVTQARHIPASGMGVGGQSAAIVDVESGILVRQIIADLGIDGCRGNVPVDAAKPPATLES